MRFFVGTSAAVLWTALALAGTAAPADVPERQVPANVSSVLAEARKLIDAGQARAAVEKLRAVEEAENPLIQELLGVAYYHANDAAKAIDHLTPIVRRLAPGSLERREATQVLGLSHYLAGHLAESV